MFTKHHARALWLAALLGLLLGIPAGCVTPVTEVPSPAVTALPTPTVLPTATAAPSLTATATSTPSTTATATVAPLPTVQAPTATTAAPALPTAVSPAAGTVSAAPSRTATAPTASPTVSTTATQTPTCCIGERCVVDGVALTVRSLTMTNGAVQGLGTPQPGRKIVLADVTIENVGGELLAFRPDLFRLKAQNGVETTAHTITPDESGNAAPGETVLLRVIYEVPESAGGFTLIYAPPSLGNREVRVDLNCSRSTR